VQFKVFAWIAVLRQKWQAAKKTEIKQKNEIGVASVRVYTVYFLVEKHWITFLHVRHSAGIS
jgi:hypothetical protein